MNKKAGFISAIIVSITVFLFAIGMLIGNNNISYLVCLVLSWGYVILACAFAVKAPDHLKIFAYVGIAFSCIYAVFIDLVYFTQLTTVLHQSLSKDVLQILSYQELGSLMFNLDLFGYGMMAISTFMIGMTIVPRAKSDKWLKALLMIHGVFAVSCVLFPMLNVFNSDMGAGGDIIGTIALLFWCAYFMPIGILSAVHFRRLT